MGMFLAVTAFRDRSTDAVADAIYHALVALGLEVVANLRDEWNERQDVFVFEPLNGWTVALWPEFWTRYIEASQAASASLGTIVSVVNVHDDDYWEHALLDSGILLDLYSSWPPGSVEEWGEDEKSLGKFRSNPRVIAMTLGVDEESIAPYLQPAEFVEVHVTDKVFPDDEFVLGNPWLFVDFWRRLGIIYADEQDEWPPTKPGQRRLRVERGFHLKLMQLDGDRPAG